MATVNKNFRIKNGLIVEGTTGTINGQNILTETGGDTYILNLVGGAALVKSVSNEFDVSAGGELSIDRTTVDSYYDVAGAAAAAQTAAEDYADGLASNYDVAGAAAAAQTAAEGFATQAIANLVDSAPATLDTLNELAAALQDNPDIISDLQDIAAGKQDTLTAGSNIDITGSTISVTGLDSADISDFNTAALSATSAAYDAAGAAAAAQTAAEDYADGLASNYDASGTAAGLVDDLKNATTPFTAINVNDVAKQVAATTGNIVTAAATTAYSWAAADFRSAKFVVKAKNGVHTQVSDLVVTLDTSNNVAVSEYGITYSNGTELAAVTADYSGTDVRIRVTPANDNTEVIVVGTLIK